MPATSEALRVSRLDNGLTVAVAPSRQAPIVTTVLWMRVGAAADGDGRGGTAHFLEHMMFKGSGRFGPGEIDRLTQSLGGSNNAFTSHDSTAYHFQFASDRWSRALEMEADRMRGLLFDPEDFASERQVILEEIAMYDSEPWDALDQRVRRALYGSHPYGHPVLGTKDELLALDSGALRDFHSRYYCPANAVLVIAGDVGGEAESLVEESFGSIPGGEAFARKEAPADYPSARSRVEVRRGEVPRLLFSLAAPAVDDPDHPRLRLLLHELTVGRSSRLHRVLVEQEQQCAWISGELSESLEHGSLGFAVELVPGAEPAAVESRLFELLAGSRQTPVSIEELERAKQIFRADWVFGHEHVYQRALSAGSALAHHDADFPQTYRDLVLACEPEDLLDVADRYLDLEGGVVGWSMPS